MHESGSSLEVGAKGWTPKSTGAPWSCEAATDSLEHYSDHNALLETKTDSLTEVAMMDGWMSSSPTTGREAPRKSGIDIQLRNNSNPFGKH